MTAQFLSGQSRLRLPEPRPNNDTSALSNAATLTASTHKAAHIGYVYWEDRSSHDIQKVHFLTGTVSINAASVIRVSLQDVSTTSGNPAVPDGTQDQTADISGASITSDTVIATGNLSANRTTAHGALLAVVIEYQTFTAADSVAIAAGRANYSNTSAWGLPICVRDTTGSWSNAGNCTSLILLEASDGTFGTFFGGDWHSALGTLSYNSGSTPDENAIEFSLPFPATIVGVWAQIAAAGDFDIVVYEGTTSRASLSVDAQYLNSSSSVRYHEFLFATPYACPKNTTHALSFKPTSGSNVIVAYEDVGAAGHRVVRGGGTAFNLNTRTDAGAWGTASTTRILRAGLILGAFDDATGGGGVLPNQLTGLIA